MVVVELDVGVLERETEQLLEGLERAVYRGLDEVARQHAEQARAQHWYRNRTGDLERSTQALEADGSVWDDLASAAVVAQEEYASYVDARSPILEPAWRAVEASATAALLQILDEAT